MLLVTIVGLIDISKKKSDIVIVIGCFTDMRKGDIVTCHWGFTDMNKIIFLFILGCFIYASIA